MKISEENLGWIEVASKDLEMTPERFLNTILRTLREEIGRPEKGLTMEEWLARGEKMERALAVDRSSIITTRAVIEEAVRAGRLYLQRMDAGREEEKG
jgi:biotin-(acetyl-CoA carboxylase) ligase